MIEVATLFLPPSEKCSALAVYEPSLRSACVPISQFTPSKPGRGRNAAFMWLNAGATNNVRYFTQTQYMPGVTKVKVFPGILSALSIVSIIRLKIQQFSDLQILALVIPRPDG